MIPCGLGARNTLRLEAAMCLYGHEIDETTTPLEAGLGWICKLGKGRFLGCDVLAQQKKAGIKRKLVGFEMLDKRIGRDGYPVSIGGREVGRVTSGGPAPFLKKNIGMAYVPPESSAVGTEIEIEHSRASGAGAHRCRCRSTSGRSRLKSVRRRSAANVPSGVSLHERSRVDQSGRRAWEPSASPITRSRNWAMWYSSSCRKSGAQMKAGAVVRHGRIGEGGERNFHPVSGEITEINPRSPTRRKKSIRTRTARRGW